MTNMAKNNVKTLPPTPWRETSLYQNLKEVTEEGYKQMLEYEKAGGELDVQEKSAKKYFEKYWRRRKRSLKDKVKEDAEMDINGDIETNDSWED